MATLLLGNLHHTHATQSLLVLYAARLGTVCPDWQMRAHVMLRVTQVKLSGVFLLWSNLSSRASGCFSKSKRLWVKRAGFCNKLVSARACQQTQMRAVKRPSRPVFHLHPSVFSEGRSDTAVYVLVNPFSFSFTPPCSHTLPFPSLWSSPVCSSAPVSMKIQPLNQTALMVSWERPLTVYHPPITSYMVSYSWVKRDVADEKTFTKTGDQSMVRF